MQFVLRLAGINTVDLYGLPKDAFAGGKLCYSRTKTKGERKDKAYMEIGVMDELLPLFAKYEGRRGGDDAPLSERRQVLPSLSIPAGG
jgi:hypothetical protein